MKILFVDNDLNGHHEIYLRNLMMQEYKCIYVLPKYISGVDCKKQYIYEGDIHSLIGYIDWIIFISNVAKNEEVDIVHFLNADVLIRYFGFLLNKLNRSKVIGTFHHFTYSYLRNISRKIVFSKVNEGIVHTDYLYDVARKSGIDNCIHVEYPVFERFDGISNVEARRHFGIPIDNAKVISAIGGTRETKGLDILLEALCDVNDNFYLLIAGKDEFFSRDFIEEKIQTYKERTFLCLKYNIFLRL